MLPDFNAKTIDLVAKRAAFLCSNPDCRATTVGPNSAPDKTTLIGEAAHICGARQGSARYDQAMSDVARAEITNAIWLCRNCHKRVDRDEAAYPADLLFAWRDDHDRFVAAKLGNKSDALRLDLEDSHLTQLADYPPLIRRIVIDKPDGWEWRLTAELMRHLNRPVFRRLRDLRDGLYVKPIEGISDDEAMHWITTRLDEMQSLISPMANLLDRLSASWGKPGEAGDVDEIHHICCLIRDSLIQVADHEERLRFVGVSETFQRLKDLLHDCIGVQAEKLEAIPGYLDDMVAFINTDYGGTTDNPIVITRTITFDLPPNWTRDMNREMKRVEKTLIRQENGGGFWSWFFGGLLFFILLMVLL